MNFTDLLPLQDQHTRTKAAVDAQSVLMREPRLLVPGMQPLGSVTYDRSMQCVPKYWYPNNRPFGLYLPDIVSGRMANAVDTAINYPAVSNYGIGIRQDNGGVAGAFYLFDTTTTVYGFFAECFWHEVSSFTYASSVDKWTNSQNVGYGLALGSQTSALTNELISFYSKTNSRVSGYCSTTDSVDMTRRQAFLFWWDAGTAALRFSWNGIEYSLTHSSTPITLADLTMTDMRLGNGSVADRIYGNIAIWDKPISASFANSFCANPSQYLVPA